MHKNTNTQKSKYKNYLNMFKYKKYTTTRTAQIQIANWGTNFSVPEYTISQSQKWIWSEFWVFVGDKFWELASMIGDVLSSLSGRGGGKDGEEVQFTFFFFFKIGSWLNEEKID